jgi:hypothetical protein
MPKHSSGGIDVLGKHRAFAICTQAAVPDNAALRVEGVETRIPRVISDVHCTIWRSRHGCWSFHLRIRGEELDFQIRIIEERWIGSLGCNASACEYDGRE